MGRVDGVLDDPPGFPYTPPGVDVLEGGKLTSNNVAGSSHVSECVFLVCNNYISSWNMILIYKDFCHKRKMYNFDPYNVLLSIATNIDVLLMTASVLQGHKVQGSRFFIICHIHNHTGYNK